MTPFLEMIQLVETDVIEPWDPVSAGGHARRLRLPPIREEGTYKGKFYVWPLLLDIIVQGWNAELVEAPGSIPRSAPKTWDEYHRQRPEGHGKRRRAVRLHLRLPRLAVADPDHPLDQHRRLHPETGCSGTTAIRRSRRSRS